MIGFLEKVNDCIALAKTDRRIWSAAGFLAMVGLLFVATEGWRQPEEEKEKRMFVPKPKEDVRADPIRSMAAELLERKKDRSELHEVIKRTESDLENGKQEMDWHMNNLVDRLNDVRNRIGKLAKDVGDREVEKARIEKKIKPAKKKKSNVYKPVDRSGM